MSLPPGGYPHVAGDPPRSIHAPRPTKERDRWSTIEEAAQPRPPCSRVRSRSSWLVAPATQLVVVPAPPPAPPPEGLRPRKSHSSCQTMGPLATRRPTAPALL